MAGRALLIGVSEYESDVIPNLDFVTNDLEALGATLTGVGYDVTTLGDPGHGVPTHNNIITGVHDFCRASGRDETVILYFSGHGLHYQGRDYLAPTDASTSDELIDRTMVPVDFAASYEQSGASAIVFFVDACREGVDLGEKGSLSLRDWTEGKRSTMERRRSAYVFACGPGQVSRYVGGPDGFSLFTRALCETINSRAGLTFGRVTTEAQKRLDRLSSRYEKKPQEIRVIAETAPGDDSLDSLRLSSGRVATKSPSLTEPSFEPDAISDVVVTSDDLTLLSVNLDARAPWVEGSILIGHVLRGAATIGKPPQWVLERLREFEPVGVQAPDVDEEVLAAITVESSDAVLLPSSTDGGAAGRPDSVPAVHILYAARRLKLSVFDAVERLRRFEPVGITAPDIDPEAVKGLLVDDTDLLALSADLDGLPPWVNGEVTTVHVLRAANELQTSVGSVVERMRRFESCGIQVDIPQTEAAGSLEVTGDDLELLSLDLDGESPWSEPSIEAGHILYAAWKREQSIGEILTPLRRFVAVGYSLPQSDSATDAIIVTSADLVPLSVDLSGARPWLYGPIPSGQLLAAAHRVGRTVGEVVDSLSRFATLGVELPSVDVQQAGEIEVTDEDIVLMSGNEPRDSLWWLNPELPIAHVLFTANRFGKTMGEILTRADRFLAVGLKVPSLTDERARHMRISDEDVRLISRDLDGDTPWVDREITWMHILQAAVALQKPVAKVMRRLRKLRPLGYTIPKAAGRALSELTVSQDDLTLLSRDLDAEEPWVGDQITSVHVLRAAHALDRPVGEIVTELRRFEPIGIELPDAEWDQLRDLRITPGDLRLLSQDADEHGPWIEGDVSPAHLLYAAVSLEQPVLDVLKRLRQFQPVGITPPDIDESGARDLAVGHEELILLSRDLDAHTPWVQGEVPLIHILRAASRIGEPVGATLKRARSLEHIGAIRLGNTFAQGGRRRTLFGRRLFS